MDKVSIDGGASKPFLNNVKVIIEYDFGADLHVTVNQEGIVLDIVDAEGIVVATKFYLHTDLTEDEDGT